VDEAITYLQQVIAAEGKNAQARTLLGSLYLQKKDPRRRGRISPRRWR
jgi:hypothetical protein